MATFIDRRLDGKNKSSVNRQRFIRRFKGQIKKAVTEAMNGRSITDIDSGEKVNIPTRDLSEPVFGHGPGGRRKPSIPAIGNSLPATESPDRHPAVAAVPARVRPAILARAKMILSLNYRERNSWSCFLRIWNCPIWCEPSSPKSLNSNRCGPDSPAPALPPTLTLCVR